MSNCDSCNFSWDKMPSNNCQSTLHWKIYATGLENKLEMKDEERDKLDVIEWLSNCDKTRKYNCKACGRHYELPIYLIYVNCVCGHRAKLRGFSPIGMEPEDMLDAAMKYFGNERLAQLAWIAEVVAGPYCSDYTADEIKKMFKAEMDRWEFKNDGWYKKQV